MGYTLIPLALKPKADTAAATELEVLVSLMQGKTTLVLGPSGAGKSTLINRLVPNAQVLTNEISVALQSGKHTTTSTTLYWVGEGKSTAVIDSPGFQEFGLNHINPMHLASLMPDIKGHSDHCKFYNCTHLHEPGCGVIAEIKKLPGSADISASRYKIYSDLFADLSQQRF
jgi:ribosome biogenesis GTPase